MVRDSARHAMSKRAWSLFGYSLNSNVLISIIYCISLDWSSAGCAPCGGISSPEQKLGPLMPLMGREHNINVGKQEGPAYCHVEQSEASWSGERDPSLRSG